MASRGVLARSLSAYLSAWRTPSVLEGLAGTGLIALGSLTPAYLPANSPWWSRLGAVGLVGPTWRIIGTILVLVGVLALIDAWFRLRPGHRWERRRGIRAGLHPWAVLGVWGLPFLAAPPIFSHDAYSYAAQGWLVINDISPYDGYPGLIPGAFADQVAQEWRYTKTPYGPLSIQIQHLMVDVAGRNPYWSAVAMRIPALVGVILIGVLLSRLARRTGHDPYFAAWFGTLNPILLIDFIGGAHNDSLMMGLTILGLFVATLSTSSWIWGALVVGVAASIKQPAFMAAIALPFLRHPMGSWRWPDLRPALGRMLASLGLAVGAFSGVSWLTGLGFGWYHAVGVPGMVITVSPFTLIGLGARQLLNLAGATQAAVGAIQLSQTVGLACGVVVVAVIAVKELPRRPLTFLAWGFLVVTVAAPALHSWYVMWGALLLPMVEDAARYVRAARWCTVALLAYAAVNLSWRNGAVAIGVAAVVVLAAHSLWRDRIGSGRAGPARPGRGSAVPPGHDPAPDASGDQTPWHPHLGGHVHAGSRRRRRSVTQEQFTDLRIDRSPEAVEVTLDRPRAINSLTGSMLSAIGEAMRGAARVELAGVGEKGFCAGADVRELCTLMRSDPEAAGAWLDEEYDVDLEIARIGHGVAHLHGVSMGGGLGLSLRLERVEAREDLVLAMPETGIGLWPDVGVCWEFSRAPELVGRHLAMTGQSIDAASALWAGLVDVVVDREGRPLDVDPAASDLARSVGWIRQCYRFDDPGQILQALAGRPEPEARAAAELISTRCPLSVAVALETVRRAERAGGVEEVLATDRVLGHSFMRHSDFAEGVRAQLVDKDRDPHWSHAGLVDVTRAEVLAMFDAD